ncbi:hypothetical protein Bbelb_240760 [Branchiostoma belcheri]|nr:hypothetical protein Bbelb_240760 [Branchiostoma belcheri]
MSLYRSLRNKVIHLSLKAKKRHYVSKVQHLKKDNPADWHRCLRQILNCRKPPVQISSPDLAHLNDGDMADLINSHFSTIVNELPPLDLESLPAYLPSPVSDIMVKPHNGKLSHLESRKTLAPSMPRDDPSCQVQLGMESGAIPDDSITASSDSGVDHEPYYGRLNGIRGYGGWTPFFRDIHQWLQVFTGNTDRNTPVTNLLDNPIDARYVRFNPQTWHGHLAMRVEILGCRTNIGIQCPALIAPSNGAVSPTGVISYPNGVTFTCNTGYVLNGAAAATCQADGTWSNPVPTCTPRQCPTLTAPTNGNLSPLGPHVYPNGVTFTCNQGYVRNGAAAATCQADGTWSNSAPTCTPIQCPGRTAPTNGAVSPTGAISFPNGVTFTCNTGYVLNGAAAATCQADGTWSNPVPTCTPNVQCPTLTAPINGAVSPAGIVSFPNGVTFTCNPGYVLNGAATARCQADGTWSNPVPTCTPVQCSSRTAPTNGAVSPVGAVSYPNGVTFSCNPGYQLNGAAAATCQADGTWSNPVPTCTPVLCPTLIAPTNGQLSPTGAVSYQNSVTFTCNPGYVLNGAAAATCQADGTWSNPVPTCTPRQCPALTAPPNGALSTTATSYQTVVTFTCNTGYQLNGAADATCQADGTWSNPVPTCTPRPCPTLTAPTNGNLSPLGPHVYPNGVTFTCNQGYVRNGAAAATCQADGTWSNSAPTCTAIQCPRRTSPTNGAVSPTGAISYPNGVTFTCNPGYVLNGASAATCQADGTWSNPVPTCTPNVQCPTRSAPINGAVSPAGVISFPNGVTFTCNPGYVLNGAAAATCQADGTWSNPVPTCTPVQCSSQTAPTNGAVSPTGAVSYPNGVNFTCNPGYVLNGAAAATCQADGTWSNPVPTCTPRQCPTLTAPPNGALSTTATSYQTVVTFTCNSGYERIGAAAATCQADETWSNPVPTCTPTPCPTLTAPTNGTLSPLGPHVYPNGVIFACNPGYVRNGAAAATCQADGTWSNSPPTCTPIQCPGQTAPTNGAVSSTGAVSYPNGVTFTCNTGYVLNGAAAATCQADGTWSNPVPTCTLVQCPARTAPINGAVSPTGAVAYPNSVTFTCNTGYVLNGAAASTCQADGTWSNPVPTCTQRRCPTLTAPPNGALSTTATSYQTVVTFTCNTGYMLNGAADATCQADGTWSNPVPTCTPRPCPTLTAPTNGALSPLGPHVYPNGVTFTCNPGYVLNGAATATCQADGTWSNPVPTCTPIQCLTLTAPTNGAVSPAGLVSYPNSVTFTCNTGYRLNGFSAATCQADGTWSNSVPTCTPVQCPARTAPINGAVSPTGAVSYPNGVTFTCNPEYILNGAAAATCQADGTWSNPVPTCTQIQCPTLTAPPNGALSTTATSYQTVVTFTCNTGYQLNGAADATCQADGTWSNPVPTCTPRLCPTLTAPTNGALSPLGPHVYPNGVTFTCNPGYVLNGAATATCQADGTWSNPVPTCTPVQCLTLTAPTNGAVSPTGLVSYPNSVTFTCNTGYQLNGFSAATCQADGTWSNPVPTCTPVQCPARTAPINGAVSPTGAVSYPNGVTFTCNTGYVLIGAAAAACQADGTWSNAVPTCTQIQCPTLTAPPNGALSTTATSYQTVVTFTCNTGYQLNGAADATCQADGTWSNPVPTCTPRPCPTLTAPTNGALSPLGPHVYPNGVTFTCNTGYVLNGAAAATCQANGTWSNPVPTCTPVQCLTLTAPTNGAVSPTGLVSYPNSVTFTCNTGYRLNGFSAATCQADGTWSNPVPTCTPVQCPARTAPINGAVSPTGAVFYPNGVTFTCNPGYVLNGAAAASCQADGTWSNPVPTCTTRPILPWQGQRLRVPSPPLTLPYQPAFSTPRPQEY